MNADTRLAFFLGGFLLGLAWARREESSSGLRSPDPTPDPKSPGKIEIQWPDTLGPGMKGSVVVVEDPPGGGTFGRDDEPTDPVTVPTGDGTLTIQISFQSHQPEVDSTEK